MKTQATMKNIGKIKLNSNCYFSAVDSSCYCLCDDYMKVWKNKNYEKLTTSNKDIPLNLTIGNCYFSAVDSSCYCLCVISSKRYTFSTSNKDTQLNLTIGNCYFSAVNSSCHCLCDMKNKFMLIFN